MIPEEHFYITETLDTQTHHWPYKATLADTRLTLYSRDSIDDAIGHVQEAIVAAFKGSYCPVVLSYRKTIALLSRDPLSRIALDFVDLASSGISLHRVSHQISGYTDWNKALMDARIGLARRAWDGHEEESAVLTDYPAEQQEFGIWARQRKAKRSTPPSSTLLADQPEGGA